MAAVAAPRPTSLSLPQRPTSYHHGHHHHHHHHKGVHHPSCPKTSSGLLAPPPQTFKSGARPKSASYVTSFDQPGQLPRPKSMIVNLPPPPDKSRPRSSNLCPRAADIKGYSNVRFIPSQANNTEIPIYSRSLPGSPASRSPAVSPNRAEHKTGKLTKSKPKEPVFGTTKSLFRSSSKDNGPEIIAVTINVGGYGSKPTVQQSPSHPYLAGRPQQRGRSRPGNPKWSRSREMMSRNSSLECVPEELDPAVAAPVTNVASVEKAKGGKSKRKGIFSKLFS